MNDQQRENVALGLEGLGFDLAARVVRGGAELVNGWRCRECGAFTDDEHGFDERVLEARAAAEYEAGHYPSCPICPHPYITVMEPAAAVIAPREIREPQEAPAS